MHARLVSSQLDVFWQTLLTPMAQVKSLASFYQQLSYCMAQYVEKVGPKPVLLVLLVDLDGRVKMRQCRTPVWPMISSPPCSATGQSVAEILGEVAASLEFQIKSIRLPFPISSLFGHLLNLYHGLRCPSHQSRFSSSTNLRTKYDNYINWETFFLSFMKLCSTCLVALQKKPDDAPWMCVEPLLQETLELTQPPEFHRMQEWRFVNETILKCMEGMEGMNGMNPGKYGKKSVKEA